MRRRTGVVLVALSILAVGVFFGYERLWPGVSADSGANTEAQIESLPRRSAPRNDETTQSLRAQRGGLPERTSATSDEPDAESATDPLEKACYTGVDLEHEFYSGDEKRRYERLVATGDMYDQYNGVTYQQLRNLAAQGDSAAMVVLGKIHELRGQDIADESAVDHLTLRALLREAAEQKASWQASRSQPYRFPTTEQAMANYRKARDWYYLAAMHGRLFALQNVGQMDSLTKHGAVEQGWVTQEDYDEMSRSEKERISPRWVYPAAASAIAPEIATGATSLFDDLLIAGPKARTFAESVARQFARDVQAEGLPFPSVPESSFPSMNEIGQLLCEEELQRLRSR